MAGGDLSDAQYLQGKPCPKCGHVRTAADTNPAWQCPRCQIVYLKYQPGAAQLGVRLAAGGRELAVEAQGDLSVDALIAANLLALLIAWYLRMSLRELMLVYWMQSVIIGISSAIRILSLKCFSTENLKMNNQQVAEDPGTKVMFAGFFVLHYGFFHFIYLLFITFDANDADPGRSALGYVLCALVFAVNHGYSVRQNIRRDAAGKPNLGTLMFLPYARIVPMHLTIIFGGLFFGGTWAFALFGALKVAADAAMHTIEHHVLAKGSVLPPPA